MIQPIVLPAGPVLLSEGRRDSPSFAISIWFPYGSRNEAPRSWGFVHFIEHMLFKGTARRDAFSLWRAIERTGGYANGFTYRDSLCVYCCVPAQYWRLAAELMAEEMTLRELRHARKLTQVRMAKKLGISRRALIYKLRAIHAGAQVDIHENKGDFVIAGCDLDSLFAGFCGDNIVTEPLEQMRRDQHGNGFIFSEQNSFLFLILHGVGSQLIFS